MFHLMTIVIISLLSLTPSQARVRDFETTRMKSTGGAGVGSILMNESAVLNPAPIAFFKNSSLYLQRETFEYTGSEQDSDRIGQWNEDSENLGVIVADTKTNLNGAIGYLKQQEADDRRERITSSLSSPISKTSALGLMYRKTTDYNKIDGVDVKDEYHQMVIGVTHVIDTTFSLGAVVVDPFGVKKEDQKAILGAQYVYKNFISLMADIGSNYSDDLTEGRVFRVASQLNFYSDLYARFGIFEDNGEKERGTGIGLAWVGPKLIMEAALKTTKPISGNEGFQTDKFQETSFALSYQF